MFHRNSMKFYLILLSLVCLLPAASQASIEPPPFPFEVEIQADQTPVKSGSMRILVNVTPRQACSEVTLAEFVTDNLAYNGMPSVTSNMAKSNSAEFILAVDIASEDTCGIEFIVSGGEFSQKAKAYWVFDGQSVKSYPGNPRLSYVKQYDQNDLSEIEVKNTTRRISENPKGKRTTGYSDEDGNLVSKKEADLSKAGLADMVNGQPRKMTQLEIDTRKMRQLEKSPLVENDNQVFILDGEVWTRSRGETRFHKAEVVVDAKSKSEHLAVQREAADKTIFDVTLDLRDPEAYDLAKSRVDNLIPMDKPGYYRVKAAGAILKELRMQGIKDATYPHIPRDSQPDREGSRPESRVPVYPDKDPADNIFYDDFAYGVYWYTWSQGASSVYWGHDDYYGEAWCAAVNGNGSTYDNNMDAWMQYSVDLTSYQNSTASFYCWYQTESGYDDFGYYISTDGSSYSRVSGPFSGTSSGYEFKSVNIANGTGTYYFAFIFYSDGSNCDYMGAYIDDFSIDGEVAALPDLCWDTPYGWDDAITVSHSMYSTSTDYPLYAGQTAYINYGVSNLGAASCPETQVDIKIDGITRETRLIPALASGETTTGFANVDWVFSPAGNHTVTIDFDAGDDVIEEDETNNTSSDTYNFILSQPDLQFVTPIGWSDPLVITNDPYDRHMDFTLNAAEEVYIHWAFKNEGNAATGPFYIGLYIDGSIYDNDYITNLNPGEEEWCEEYPITLPQGSHTVQIRLDYLGDVQESSESNNITQTTQTWAFGTIEVSGKVYYERWGTGGPPTFENAEGIKVELWDANVPANTSRYRFATTYTASDGSFSFPPITNQDNDGTTLDLIVWAYSETGDVIVKQDYYDNIGLDIPSPWIEENVASGYFDAWTGPNGIYAVDNGGGFFYTAMNLQENYDLWVSTTGRTMSQTVAVIESGQTQYDDFSDFIIIALQDDITLGFPDHFDRCIHAHEFAHRLEWVHDFLDSHPMSTGYWDELRDANTAASEGFAYFWPQYWINPQNPLNFNNFDFNQTTQTYENAYFTNNENGEHGYINPPQLIGSANCMGDECYGTVAGIFWDIYDNGAGLEDYSGGPGVDWGFTHWPHTPDGRGDHFTFPINNMLTILMDKHDPGVHIENMEEFWNAWFHEPSEGYLQEMKDIWYEHGIDKDNFTDADDVKDARPITFDFKQNYPNPFNPTTTIEYSIPSRKHVSLTIYNILGEKVRTLVDEFKSAGFYKIEWDGTDDAGKGVASGIYFSRMEAGEYTQTHSMTLLK